MKHLLLVLVLAVPLWCADVAHAAVCHGGIRPDVVCTPGATNPAVTQVTIGTTICVKGWTSTVRPPVRVTAPIKRERMAAYGVGRQSPARYELDHFIPLELGGATVDIRNLWPEYLAGKRGALTKDGVENKLRARVCRGMMTLAEAQRQIVKDWTRIV